MKKFLLVLLIGMVLAMDVYGIVKEVIDNYSKVEQEDAIDRTTTIIYVE